MADNIAMLVAVTFALILLFMFLYIQRLLSNSVTDMWESESLEAPYVYAAGLVLGAIVLSFFSLRIIEDPLVVSINITGFLVPISVAICIVMLRKVTALATLISIVLVAAVAFFVTNVTSGAIVIEFPWWLAPVAVAAICGYSGAKDSDPLNYAALAYVAGSMGVLVGGDLAKIPEFVARGGYYLVLGGGGMLDFVFLLGVFAVAALWGTLWAVDYIRRIMAGRSELAEQG
jgi:uncharacterized membrane protein